MTHTFSEVARRTAARLLNRSVGRSKLALEALEHRDVPAGTYSGVVFQDFNANGVRDLTQVLPNNGNGTISAAIDTGVGGVVVTAFSATGIEGVATTAADGTYTLNATGTGPYRLEFTALPAGFRPGPQGPDSGTTTQFVADGGLANVNVGLVEQGAYAQDNPIIVTSILGYGDPISGPNADQSAIVGFPYTSGGTSGANFIQPTARAIDIPFSRVGAIYGVAYDSVNRDLYASAFFRRHSGFGEGGTGAIYRAAIPEGLLNGYNPPAGSLLYADLNAIFGGDTAGPNLHDTADYDRDNNNTGWAAVGTTGLGGLDNSDDGRFIFVMNLADRQLYRIPTSGPLDATTIQRVSIPLGNPNTSVISADRFRSDDLRPFAVTYHKGQVYVGVTYTAQTLSTGPNDAAARDELLSAVYQLNPETMTFTAAPIFTARLNYARNGSVIAFAEPGANITPWRPWSPTYFSTASNPGYGVAPQPMLSGITFDSSGNMTLSLRDRGADQIGSDALSNPSSGQRIEGFAAGDALHAFINTPNNFANGWVLENNARGPNGEGTGPQGNNTGPGGGEFFFQDNFGNNHLETGTGAVLQLPGRPDVISAQMDPGSQTRAAGFSWFNTTAGTKAKGFQLYRNETNGPTTFAKSNGTGGLTAILEPAPVEVGNRVFLDTNRDGIQDPGEPAIANVRIELLDSTGAVIAVATTDANGTYYFTSAAGPVGADADSRRFNVPFVPGGSYSIRVPNATGVGQQAALAGLAPTLANVGNVADPGQDLRDSDGVLVGTASQVTFTIAQLGDNSHAFDFGFRTPGNTISGVTYSDLNNDGLLAGSETLITGQPITYTLTGTSFNGTPVNLSVTTTDGTYFFDEVPASNAAGYTITQVNQPVGFLDGRDTPGTPFGGAGSGTGAGDVITGVVVPVGPASNGINYNFGELLPARLGDFVWLDANGNGRQDAGEAGVNGITVTLTGTDDRGAVNATTLTAGNGAYEFVNLRPGTYTVTFGNTAGGVTYTRTFQNVAGASTAIDSNANPATGAAAPVTLVAGQNDPTIDAGLYLPVSLGDRVWFDTNGNGTQDPGEPGIVGATVTVTYAGPDGDFATAGDNVVSVIPTGADGIYLLENLPPGNYRVSVNPNTGTVNGVPAAGLTITFDRDSGTVNPDGISTQTINSGQNPRDIDFGYVNFPGALGDRVWLDRNANGVQDADEPGLAGLTVTAVWAGPDGDLATTGDNVSYTTTTGVNGIYNFPSLPLGLFRVTVNTAGTNLTSTFDLDSGTVNPDNTSLVTLTPTNPVRTDVDFGVRSTATIGDTVWYDADNSGTQNNGEPGIAGVVVTLTGAGADGLLGTPDDINLTTTTSGSGTYLFTNLPVFGADDLYRVTVTPPTQFPVQTFDADGLGTANQSTLTLAANGVNLDQDFGYRAPLTQGLGDFVWLDANGNGVQDAGETGINGITVELLDSTGAVLAVTTTGANPNGGAPGYYEFRGLPAGTYSVRFGNTAAGITYVRTQQNSPVGTPETDSNASAANGTTGPITLLANTFDPTIDAGLYFPASLGDTVWYDADNSGTQNNGEPGIAGVVVSLDYAGPDGQFGTADDEVGVATQTTDAAGNYLFGGLRPGTYRVTVNPATLPAGLTEQTFDLDGLATANTAIAAITSGQNRLDADFGYRGTATLGDTVWYDLDRSGTQNNNEPGIAGVRVTLVWAGPDGQLGTADDLPIGTQTTSATGEYLFTGLPAGLYRAVVDTTSLPAGVTVNTFDLDSGLVNPDSAANATLGVGENRRDVDFGYTGTGSIGDRVWLDTNGNGTQDPGEPGLPGVPVILEWAGPDGVPGTGNEVTLTVTTGADGLYSFPDLPPGDYTIRVLPPPGAVQTGDPDGVLDNQSAVTLQPNQNVTTVDFGYQGTSSISGFVFVDSNRDGVRQESEPPIPATLLTLSGTDIAGNPVLLTTTTGADGSYTFLNLAPGTYTVTQTQPALWGDGGDAVGTINGVPVGMLGNDVLSSITLGNNEVGINYNFGEIGGSITGVSFFDANRDGIRNPDELPLENVLVTLTGPDGITRVATTGPDDSYIFTDLPAGEYTVTETQPAGFGNPPGGPFAPDSRPVSLPPGIDIVEQNFGNTLGTISGTVFADINGDGLLTPGEPGIPGVTVILTNDTTGTTFTTTTAADGTYIFTGLPAGTYTLTEIQPAGFDDGEETIGGLGGIRVAPDTITSITMPPGGDGPNYNFGELPQAQITGRVFLDRNQDGIQQPGEEGLPGVIVTLLDPNGNVIATTTTDAIGNYSFPGVPPGNYIVRETQPAGLGDTPGTGGNDRAVTVPGGGGTVVVPSFPNTLGSISGTVYLDFNLSGGFDPVGVRPDTGIPGIVMTLLDASGTVIRVTNTDANGNYLFPDLPAGSYTVVQSQPPLPTTLTNGFYDGLDNVGSVGGTQPAKNQFTVPLPAGTAAISYNFGELSPADPFGFVYIDANRNGTRDPGEVGIPNVAITISGTAFAGTPFERPLTAADVPGGFTTRTDSTGRYEFAPIPPGIYTLTQTQPAGFLDGLEENRDPNGPFSVIVGNDVFSNIILSPFPVRGPFNFGEFLNPTVPPLPPIDFFPPVPDPALDASKREFLGSTGQAIPTVPNPAPVLPTAPSFSTRTTAPATYAVAESIGGGQVRVFDYQSGVERFRFTPYPGFTGGVNVVTADVTGDGVPDIITTPGAGGGPIIRIFDGLTGREIGTILAFEDSFRGGLQVTAGDITGDGVADIIVAPDAGGGPIVRAFNGRTFNQVANFFALDETLRGGLRLAAGDVNADGRADLIVTAGIGGGPRVAGYDGRTLTAPNPGKLFGDFFAFAPELRSGFFATVGDVNGDGFADVILGAGPGGGPRYAAYSGRALSQNGTPTTLVNNFAGDPNSRAGVRLKAIDLTGDGLAELVATPGSGVRPVTLVINPRTGVTIDQFYAFPVDFNGGVTVG